jgi:serine phosphatase RsbU (regulator of sigma subunit)
VGIVIGDVSGKGFETAAFAAIARSTIRAFCYESSSAAEALTQANAVLCARQEERREDNLFMTAFLMILDPATGSFQYANAGHPLPAICNRNGEVNFLQIGQLPLGITSVQYENAEGRLDPGDKLLLYTDGVIEARRENAVFGETGLACHLCENARFPSEKLLDRIYDTICSWTGGSTQDDTAMVLVERDS